MMMVIHKTWKPNHNALDYSFNTIDIALINLNCKINHTPLLGHYNKTNNVFMLTGDDVNRMHMIQANAVNEVNDFLTELFKTCRW